MSINLVDTVKALFSGDVITKAGARLGETETGVTKAISGIVPTVILGFIKKSASPGGAGNLFNLAKQEASGTTSANLSGILGGAQNSFIQSKGADLLKNIFADKTESITHTISSFSGVKGSSAASLMNATTPAALGVLGNHLVANNMSVSDLSSLLKDQKDSVMRALPTGLNLSSLGVGSMSDIGSKISSATSRTTSDIKNTSGSRPNRIWPWIIIIILILLLFYFWRGCGERKGEMATLPPPDTAHTNNPLPPTSESIKVRLPDGTELSANKGGIEDKLVNFLNDPNSKAGKDVWFDFDKLNFKTGSAEITDESASQIRNITAILKAYPKLKIKIGGYTDKTGDSLANIKLSQSRADAVVDALRSAGANALQLSGAEGYGAQFAKAAADAPDTERQKDRRISIGVREK